MIYLKGRKKDSDLSSHWFATPNAHNSWPGPSQAPGARTCMPGEPHHLPPQGAEQEAAWHGVAWCVVAWHGNKGCRQPSNSTRPAYFILHEMWEVF